MKNTTSMQMIVQLLRPKDKKKKNFLNRKYIYYKNDILFLSENNGTKINRK